MKYSAERLAYISQINFNVRLAYYLEKFVIKIINKKL